MCAGAPNIGHQTCSHELLSGMGNDRPSSGVLRRGGIAIGYRSFAAVPVFCLPSQNIAQRVPGRQYPDAYGVNFRTHTTSPSRTQCRPVVV